MQFLDFSKENDYLLYLDDANETTIIDMTNQNKINAIQIDTDYDWASDGIQISEKIRVYALIFAITNSVTQGIYRYYTNENKVTKIVLTKDDRYAIVADQMGTVSYNPFKQPNPLPRFGCSNIHAKRAQS